MEISRKNQWVEEDEGGAAGNVAPFAKVRKGRDAAKGRWKSTEHVNEVGCNKQSYTLFLSLLARTKEICFSTLLSKVFDPLRSERRKISETSQNGIMAMGPRSVSPSQPISFNTHVEHRRAAVCRRNVPFAPLRPTSDDLQSFLSERHREFPSGPQGKLGSCDLRCAIPSHPSGGGAVTLRPPSVFAFIAAKSIGVTLPLSSSVALMFCTPFTLQLVSMFICHPNDSTSHDPQLICPKTPSPIRRKLSANVANEP